MESNTEGREDVEAEGEEEEFVLLDLDEVCGKADIPPNAPYVLSGLDTMNPVLVIGDELKLIGEYQETIGTCFVFSENDGPSVTHEEAGPSGENPVTDRNTPDENQGSEKQVKPIARLQKVLKFRLCPDTKAHATEDEVQILAKQPEAKNLAAEVEVGS